MKLGGLYGGETKVNAMRTTGAGSTSFTSTVMAHTASNDRAREIIVRNPKKKGYARITTNVGDLNVELHCDVTPRTCENFIALAKVGYYENTVFHRSVRNFMIQGGDPSGTGTGGRSIWGGNFKDELTHLKHDGRGVVSMANSGKHTNGSQFFVLYKSASHLDGKHSVFGNVVGGMETLAKMERAFTDARDKPLVPITIEKVEVFVDPYEDAALLEQQLSVAKQEKEEKDIKQRVDALNPGKWWSNPSGEAAREAGDAPVAKSGAGVGKYVGVGVGAVEKKPGDWNASGRGNEDQPGPAKKSKTGGYGNFDGW